MLKLLIGNKTYSSWSMRGWLAVKQSGLPFEEIVLPMFAPGWEERKAQADLAPSRGKVPMLWDGDICVWDSLAILEWLDAKTGGTRFWPADPAARALAHAMVAEMHAGYQALRSQHGMNLRHRLSGVPVSVEAQDDIDRICALWSQARSRFGAGGIYLFGSFGAADIAFAPVVTRFVTYGIALPEDAAAYVAAMMAHPWMRDWYESAAAEPWIIDKYEPAAAN